MIDRVKSSSKDHNFGSFAMGVAVGVGAVLLFGTEEGKKLAQNLFDALPEKLKTLTDDTSSLRDSYSNQSNPSGFPEILSEPESTPHTYVYNEPPPRPAPHVTPSIPTL